MTDKSENPAAFPFTASDRSNLALQTSGMTLRDWFAGQALAGIVCSERYDPEPWEGTAKAAYQVADAMLAERIKP